MLCYSNPQLDVCSVHEEELLPPKWGNVSAVIGKLARLCLPARGVPVCLWVAAGPPAQGSLLYQHRAGGEELTGAEGEDGTCSAGVSSCGARGNGARGFLPANAANLDKPSLESWRSLQKGQRRGSETLFLQGVTWKR